MAIIIFIGFVVVFVGIVLITIWYAFTPTQCPKCGHNMSTYYDEKNDIYTNECRNCGYEERL